MRRIVYRHGYSPDKSLILLKMDVNRCFENWLEFILEVHDPKTGKKDVLPATSVFEEGGHIVFHCPENY